MLASTSSRLHVWNTILLGGFFPPYHISTTHCYFNGTRLLGLLGTGTIVEAAHSLLLLRHLSVLLSILAETVVLPHGSIDASCHKHGTPDSEKRNDENPHMARCQEIIPDLWFLIAYSSKTTNLKCHA